MTLLKPKPTALFLLFAAVAVQAQTYHAPPTFKHIVIIVQENRTPDNLFGAGPSLSNCGNEDPFELGVDIQDGGPNRSSVLNGGPAITCNTPMSIPGNQNIILDHTHNPGWTNQCDMDANGHCQMDGACLESGWTAAIGCPQYTYVPKTIAQPYFDIASNYGFANYMFQTNQGPSFPAHQFIFGGTSAPVFPGDPQNYFQDFVAENAAFLDSGCPVGTKAPARWINPGNQELLDPNRSECYDRNTLATYQIGATIFDKFAQHNPQLTWKYYTPTTGIIWDAPEADPQTCYTMTGPPNGNPPCSGAEWANVSLPNNNTSAPVLTDIENCHLPSLSWVIPDEAWSDHPGPQDLSYGPSWVADIVDGIGNATNCDGAGYWSDTVIFIVWDDWGGFYDHVPPPAIYKGTYNSTTNTWSCTTQDQQNGWGCGYVYGFRVPLLVVSKYTPPATISGAIPSGQQPTYPPSTCWTHDFGSILKFTENNFLGSTAQIAPPGYTYADQNSLDTVCNQQQNLIPLWEFFLANPTRSFTNINSSYPAVFFTTYYLTNQGNGVYPQPTGPEDGDPYD